jgi:hypothetical protein
MPSNSQKENSECKHQHKEETEIHALPKFNGKNINTHTAVVEEIVAGAGAASGARAGAGAVVGVGAGAGALTVTGL